MSKMMISAILHVLIVAGAQAREIKAAKGESSSQGNMIWLPTYDTMGEVTFSGWGRVIDKSSSVFIIP